MEITRATKRQFAKLLEKYGKTVYDVENACERKVMFLKESARAAQEKIKISYPQDYPWDKGTVIKYKDMYFLIIGREAFESDVYHTSIAIKCNCKWFINGTEYYLVAGELSSPNPRHGTYIDGVNGSISLYTNTSKVMNINDKVFDFGGTYTCNNKFTIDKLTYYYLSRTETDANNWTLSFGNVPTEVEKDTTLQLTAIMDKDNYYIPSDQVTTTYYYTSSDPTVATVDNTGLVSFLKNGTVSISCDCYVRTDEVSLTATGSVTFTVIATGQPYASVEVFAKDLNTSAYTLPIDEDNNYSYSKDYMIVAHYFNSDGVEQSGAVPVSWDIEDTNGENTAVYIEGDDTYGITYTGTIYYDEEMTDYETKTTSITITTNGNKIIMDVAANSNSKALYYNPIKITATYLDGTTVSYTRLPLSSV